MLLNEIKQQIPGVAKNVWGGTKGFFKGLFGVGN
jgi:hypothetical protein